MIQLTENRLTERDLMRTSSRAVRICQCACGGQIGATDGDWDDVVEALRTHQQGALHRAWRWRRGL